MNASQAQKKLCIVYEENIVNDRTRQKWFAMFRGRHFSLNNAPRPIANQLNEVITLE